MDTIIMNSNENLINMECVVNNNTNNNSININNNNNDEMTCCSLISDDHLLEAATTNTKDDNQVVVDINLDSSAKNSISPSSLVCTGLAAIANNNTNNNSNVNSQNNSNNRPFQVEAYLNILMHAYQCSTINCTYNKCSNFKIRLEHLRKCCTANKTNCDYCRQIIALIIYHAKDCKNEDCKLILCSSIKAKLEQEKQNRNKLILCKEFISCYLNYIVFNKSCNRTDSDLDMKKNELTQKLNEMTSSCCTSSNSGGGTTNELFLDKKLREELVKYVFQICCLEKSASTRSSSSAQQSPTEIYKDLHYASLVACLFKKENDLFNENKFKPIHVYLNLFTEMVYTIYNEFDKHLNQINTTNNSTASSNNPKKMKLIDDDNEYDNDSLDTELINEYIPASKRLRLDDN